MTAFADAIIIDGRHEIDEIDAEICALVNRRLLAARKIAEARVGERDLEREAKVISRYLVRIVSRSDPVRALATAIIETCRPR